MMEPSQYVENNVEPQNDNVQPHLIIKEIVKKCHCLKDDAIQV